MATYTASVATFRTPGRASANLTQGIMSISNKYTSNSFVYIRRLIVQVDCTAVYTAVMPQVVTSKCIMGTPPGGTVLTPVKFDTSANPEATIEVRGDASADGTNSATSLFAGTQMFPAVYQQFTMRMHTAVGQMIGAIDNPILPNLIMDNNIYTLYPGETLVVQVVAAATAGNPTTNHWWVEAIWEEPATFAISGTVTLSGNPVSGAIVFVLYSDDTSGTNTRLRDVVTTDGSGNWSSSIPTGHVGSAFVQYNNGGTYYTAPGNPFLQ
jgi:hypothetical protein